MSKDVRAFVRMYWWNVVLYILMKCTHSELLLWRIAVGVGVMVLMLLSFQVDAVSVAILTTKEIELNFEKTQHLRCREVIRQIIYFWIRIY